jgi:hypothetical protein
MMPLKKTTHPPSKQHGGADANRPVRFCPELAFREVQTGVLCGRTWLGGRDSNPDNVVQRTVDGLPSALVRAFSGRFSPSLLRRLPFVSLRSCAMCLTVSHPRPPSLLASMDVAQPGTGSSVRRRCAFQSCVRGITDEKSRSRLASGARWRPRLRDVRTP